MKKPLLFVVLCVLLAIVADRPPPAEASPGVVMSIPRKEIKEPIRAVEPLGEEWTVTAYCPCERCCGRWAHYRGGGWTASGARARAGVTVAVDPAIVPLGSRIWIEGLGWRIAQDTGSAVRGRHVDVYMDNHEAAAAFGVQRKMVLVVKE